MAYRDGTPAYDAKTYIQALKYSPKNVLSEKGILSEYLEGDQLKMFRLISSKYLAKFEWVERYQPGDTAVAPELVFDMASSWKIKYRPEAEKALALLRIAREVFDRDPEGWAQKTYRTAEHWWFSCFMAATEIELSNCGLTGHPLLIGKKQQSKMVMEAVDEWLNWQSNPNGTKQRMTFSEWENRFPDQTMTPEQLLFNYASSISRNDVTFSIEFSEQMKRIRRFERIQERDKDMKNHILIDGEIQTFDTGKRGTDKKKRKGFCKQT